MDSTLYKKLMSNTINFYLTDYNLQDILNRLRKNKIATYSEKDKDENKDSIILISTNESKSERINKCINNNIETFYIIENELINKSYRYTIYFNCDNFKINSNIEKYININSFKKDKFDLIDDFERPIYFENSDYICFAFLKSINPFINKIDKTVNVLYPTLWVYHKNLKILEHRFDMLGFKSNDDFYEITFEAQLSKLCSDFGCKYSGFKTSKTIEYIVNNKKREVVQISESMGLKANGLAKLKVGDTLVMPFIGDLEEIIKSEGDLFSKDKYTILIREMLENYIHDIKKNARYHSRLLSWVQEEYSSLSINILFGYRNKSYDLFNFQNPKKINMELMNYGIKYICEAKRATNNAD